MFNMDGYIIWKPRLGIGFHHSSNAVPSTSTNITCRSGGDGKHEDNNVSSSSYVDEPTMQSNMPTSVLADNYGYCKKIH